MNQVNTDLLEVAGFHQQYWEGVGIGEDLDTAVAQNDLEQVEVLVKESARIMFALEYDNPDPTTPERAEAMVGDTY